MAGGATDPTPVRARGAGPAADLADLDLWLAALVRGERAAPPLRAGSTLRALAEPPAAPPPSDLIARAAPTTPLAWHRAALLQLLEAGAHETPRARYHAAWLRQLRAPEEPACRVPASVVIPVRDGEPFLLDAVSSALALGPALLEVVVVDDGSARPAAELLASVDEPRLRVLETPPRGVAAARNAGVAAARGVLVQFLDADDVLDADALDAKSAALAAVPDAELCAASYRSVGRHAVKQAETHRPPPFGDARCPTRDLLGCAAWRYPFHTSSVLVARHALCEAGPMEERLGQGEDAYQWFRLGLRGTKVVALDRPLGTRRFHPRGLTSDEDPHVRSWVHVGLLALRDLLGTPQHGAALACCLWRFGGRARAQAFGRADDALTRQLLGEVAAALAALPERCADLGLSARPHLALVDAALHGPRARKSGANAALRNALAAAARDAARRAAPIGSIDARTWLDAAGGPQAREVAPAVLAVVRAVDDALARGVALLPLAELPRLGLVARGHPAAARLKRVSGWAHHHGEEAALRRSARAFGGPIRHLPVWVREALGRFGGRR